jgi:riboflavin kinase/FMN adenylyltransferase
MSISIIGVDHYMATQARSICLGSFDGVHLGHQALLKQADFMLTFDPHPKQVLAPEITIERLTFPNEQHIFFPNQLIVPFTKVVAQMPAIDFLNHGIGPLQPKKIVVGADFKFGRYGKGGATLLKEWGAINRCTIDVVQIQHHSQALPYKSSIIRTMLKADPNQALELLGHPYLMIGTVVPGNRKGREMGVPTANLQVPDNKCLPAYGVYASYVGIDGCNYPSITNIGVKPTFSDHTPSIETHILDSFSEHIYHQQIQLFLLHFIRPEQAFSSESALVSQMQQDIIQANQYHQMHPQIVS